jgi:capsule biosynthesis phosphatase
MKFIILCGGTGQRCNNYSLPKPLNYINGKHLIEYIIDSIPTNDIYIIYNIFLDQYNFREIIINKLKNKQIYFSVLDFLTRGAVETAYIGIKKFNLDLNDKENILFIDNDNYHIFPKINNNYINNFIFYGTDYIKQNYSFITIELNNVINIEEKNKISDNYCCGLYGFINLKEFLDLSEELINKNLKTKNEFYFSHIYKLLIEKKKIIIPIKIEKTQHLGTIDEIINNNNLIKKNNKLRLCFDLDNTLVTYPSIPNDYTTVKPIQKMIDILNDFKQQGHEIIIYTARRMHTHNNNIGKVMKDIGMITFETLEKFNIKYDEIIFGKPIADIYIDDRSLNPYYNNFNLFGFFNLEKQYIPNKIKNNKYNSIEKNDNIIKKIGPEKFVRGELYFYQTICKDLQKYFVNLISYNIYDNLIEINIEYINGIPLYYLYKNKTLTFMMIDKLFNSLNEIHTHNYPITINNELIKKNYIDKLKDRFNKNDYPFGDAENLLTNILQELELNYNPEIVPIIHGDFWFSNIILTYDDEFKFIDMKGQIYNELTLNGDKYYDFGKLYQSILGYDLIINNDIYHTDDIDDEYYKNINNYFINKCTEINLDIKYLKSVTKSLIFGTFHFLKNDERKHIIWNLLKTI